MTSYDAIIVGLGPGGSTAARLLAASGCRVLGLDKEQFPRYKPCGGGLSARVLAHLPDSVRPSIEATVRQIHFTYRGRRTMRYPSTRPLAFMVRRSQFDHKLADAAEQTGAELRYGEQVQTVIELPDCIEVHTRAGQRYRARFLIGSDGANSRIGRLIDPGPAARPAWSLEAETPRPVGSSSASDVWLDLGTVQGGYGWSFPKAEHLSIGVASFEPPTVNPKHALLAYLQAQRPIDPETPLTLHSHPIPAAPHPWRRLAAGRLLVVGDAARLVDPFFGEGIYYAIRSGELAAEAVAHVLRKSGRDVAIYDEWVRQQFEQEFRLATKLATIAYRLPFLWYLAMRAWPEMTEQFYDVLRGEQTYRQILIKLHNEGSRYLAAGLRHRVAQLFS